MPKFILGFFYGLGFVMILGSIFLYWRARKSQLQTPDLGYDENGQLRVCPDSPNCVSTQAKHEAKRLPPLSYSGDSELTISRLRSMVEAMPRTQLLREEPTYLHFAFQTAVFPFVDDVEFLCDDQHKVIHYRSASREGYSDLGANARRMKKIAARWSELSQ